MVSSRSILNFTDITLCSIRFWLGLSWVCVEPQDEHSLQRTRLSMKLFVKTIWGQLIELKTSVFCVVFKSMFRSIFFILFRSVFFSSAFLHILFRSFRTIYESEDVSHPSNQLQQHIQSQLENVCWFFCCLCYWCCCRCYNCSRITIFSPFRFIPFHLFSIHFEAAAAAAAFDSFHINRLNVMRSWFTISAQSTQLFLRLLIPKHTNRPTDNGERKRAQKRACVRAGVY